MDGSMKPKKKKITRPYLKTGRPVPKGLTPAKKGEVRNPEGRASKSVLTCIKERLSQKDPNTKMLFRERAAVAYVEAMMTGSFNHHKEIFDREDGKVTDKVTIDDGSAVKRYINMPISGPGSPIPDKK